ncbi:hypothetical protein PMPD1_3207 [Paramixta manurensis]|uniref:DUF2919 domain-containing protein n=1 Tax=Paramixta manurensis TaxID=2740817 RepID=A0A6M8UMI6_9GAMM|nr:hypothetical protein PMPD1_3207 [Erwiniaceae bacterium PD-1]
MSFNYSPDAYDNKGQLRLPVTFWLVLLVQARTWVLFVMAGASRQQGASLLALFYPDSQAFWLGLGLGVPAALGLLLTGYRQRLPRLWQSWRYVLSISLFASALLQGWWWQDDDSFSPAVAGLMAVDLLAMGYLLGNRRLRDVFNPRLNGAE